MRIGVYLCTCSGNIGERFDLPALEAAVAGLPDVAYVQQAPLICSVGGQAELVAHLAAERPDRVVFGACSPREHERTFMGVLEAAGINPYFMQLVNLREQVAWVTPDREQATAKALSLLHGAVARVPLQEPLEKGELEASPAVLVIGAGPAGMKAALTLAGIGRPVLLVEKSPVIGGLPVRCEELFPSMECGPCLLEPLMGELLHGEHLAPITLLTMAEVVQVAGSCGNFLVTVRRQPRFVDEERCIGCGECSAACPAGVLNEYQCGFAERKAIDVPFAGALPNVPFIDRSACRRWAGEECSACAAACPLGEDLIDYAQEPREEEHQVGAILVATGAGLLDCGTLPALGYGASPDIYTSLELERLLASNGPTGGVIATRAGQPPARVVLVHCVGSREAGHSPYCSEVCCRGALKYRHLLHDRLPGVAVRHFVRELSLPGKGMAGQCSAGVPAEELLRYTQLDALEVVPAESGGYLVRDRQSGAEAAADLVVLCPAIVPAADAPQLARILDIPRDRFGFFAELHDRVDAARSKVRGVFLAGSCQAPMDLQRTMLQGQAAAAGIVAELPSGQKLEIDPVVARVEEELCGGCRLCGPVCPFRAISYSGEPLRPEVNPLLCQGCGTCAAACPAGAIRQAHYSREALLAEIDGVLA